MFAIGVEVESMRYSLVFEGCLSYGLGPGSLIQGCCVSCERSTAWCGVLTRRTSWLKPKLEAGFAHRCFSGGTMAGTGGTTVPVVGTGGTVASVVLHNQQPLRGRLCGTL